MFPPFKTGQFITSWMLLKAGVMWNLLMTVSITGGDLAAHFPARHHLLWQQEDRGAVLVPATAPVPRSWTESSGSCFMPCHQAHTTCWILPWAGALEQVPLMRPALAQSWL